MALDFINPEKRYDKGFDGTKVWISNSKEAINVQKAMFKKGFRWNGSEKNKVYDNCTTKGALFFNDGKITQAYDNAYFEEEDNREITIKDILGKLLTPKQRKTKIDKIVNEIKKNKDYFSCFENLTELKKDVNSWDETKLKNWEKQK